jgi:ATP-dependent 26S proteasome regulatory subunit
MFTAAGDRAPSVLVIDEMEAFLTDRSTGEGSASHRVEEVAEFLRRIPEAARQRVLVVAMTNRIDTIDPAILRRGRFDHLVEVGVATTDEIEALLKDLLGTLPHADDVEPNKLARALGGRPLSDVGFVLREAGRLAARQAKDAIDMASLESAIAAAPARDTQDAGRPRIGFAP